MTNTTKRAAIYARVSTKFNGQNPETQLHALREYVKSRGWTIAGEYVDHGVSGTKDSRPQLDKLMKDARSRKIDAVIVARFDRFARSVKHLLTAPQEQLCVRGKQLETKQLRGLFSQSRFSSL
jgi:DNA invertase Pin-like site-specific DNA recombinase